VSRRRVVITGIGLVTPFGTDRATIWQAVTAGRSAVTLLHDIDGIIPGPVLGAPVRAFEAEAFIDTKSLRLMVPSVAFGVAAAKMAGADSGLAFDRLDRTRLGVFVGSRGHGTDRRDLSAAVRAASDGAELDLTSFARDGLALVHPMWLLKGLANNVLYFVSLEFGAQGMNNNLSLGGVAATTAIGEASRAIERGHLNVALAGGYDTGLNADRVEMFALSGLMTSSTDAVNICGPFDRARDGFIASEGAGFLVLEAHEAAIERGARIYGEVLGYGCCTAPAQTDTLGPSAEGFAGALRAALDDAGLDRPDAVFVHGLATPESDRAETAALYSVFAQQAPAIPAPALKSIVGNSAAASGTIEAALALMALEHGVLPPTINLHELDPGSELDHVAGYGAREHPMRTVAVANASLAGHHAVLVLGRQ
jgi:3-oxoacyl-[acyl-carrier-protein] synthase II